MMLKTEVGFHLSPVQKMKLLWFIELPTNFMALRRSFVVYNHVNNDVMDVLTTRH